ncbi:MAG: phosphatase PAP2 family protein [Cytophagales bacterium]|nr:phosphatase PAP2 family protein [Cytophagales bacterium]
MILQEILDYILKGDKALFLFLNGFHSEGADWIMAYVTGTKPWIPFYLLLAYLLFKKYGKAVWLPLLGVALTIVVADQVTSGFMKPFFARLRPSWEPELEGMVHLVTGRGGKYGFASSHAANSFGLATFLYLLYLDNRKYVGWMFVWAAVVSYSRIYVGKHYPLDIFAGALVGIAGAYGIYSVFLWVWNKLKNRENERIRKAG